MINVCIGNATYMASVGRKHCKALQILSLKGLDNAIAANCNIVIGHQIDILICAGDFLAENLGQLHQGDMKNRVGIHMYRKTRGHHSARNNLCTITHNAREIHVFIAQHKYLSE